MATDVIMPALGVAQEKGTLLKWLKAEGQSVNKGEPLMEIETDKATVEIEAPASGTLTSIAAKPGDEVPVGQRIALILVQGEAPPTRQEVPAAVLPSPPPTVGEGGGERQSQTSKVSSTPGVTAATSASRVLASPKAKRLAGEKGVNLTVLRGSGPEGSILAEDVLRAVRNLRASAPAPTAVNVEPLSSMRRIVGQRMTESKQNVPHFYLSVDIDMTAVCELRTRWKDHGNRAIPSLNAFILQACARALKDFPSLNASYTERGIECHSEINLGFAVALDEGLVAPVIRNAGQLGLRQLAEQSRQLAEKAQNKKLLPLDYEGGTFTVSNLGMLGVDRFIAIINPPQCAILAVGKVAPRVVADNGMFAIRSLMTVTLSTDHRVVDGAVAAHFLESIKRFLEAPEV